MCSCVAGKIDKRLTNHQLDQIGLAGDLSQPVFKSDYKKINWEQASKRLLEGNAQVLASRKTIQDAKKAKKKIWLDLIPDVFTFANINTALTEISDFSSEDVSAGAFANLQIPSPFRVYAQRYAAQLSIIQAEYNYELTRRQQYAALYTLFLKQEKLDESHSEIKELENELDSLPIIEAAQAHRKISISRGRLAISRERFRVELNRFFNTPGQNWRLTGGLENISYANKLNKLNFKNNYGILGIKLQAIQLEYAVVARKGVRLNRLPDLNVNFNSSRIFNISDNDDAEFNLDNLQLFTGLTKNVNVTDVLDKDRVQNAEYRFQLNREQLRLRLESEASQLKINKKIYRGLLANKRELQKALNHITQSKNYNSTQVLTEVESYQSAKNQIDTIDKRLLSIDLQLWIWDEKYWSKH